MKKALTFFLAFLCVVKALPLPATDKALSTCEIKKAYPKDCASPVGYGADRATSTTISMSMMGWGLGLAIAIAITAGMIHQSRGAVVHSSTNNPE